MCKVFGSQQCASFRLGSSQQQMQSPALRPSVICFAALTRESPFVSQDTVLTERQSRIQTEPSKAQWERPVVATYKANAFLLSDARVKN